MLSHENRFDLLMKINSYVVIKCLYGIKSISELVNLDMGVNRECAS